MWRVVNNKITILIRIDWQVKRFERVFDQGDLGVYKGFQTTALFFKTYLSQHLKITRGIWRVKSHFPYQTEYGNAVFGARHVVFHAQIWAAHPSLFECYRPLSCCRFIDHCQIPKFIILDHSISLSFSRACVVNHKQHIITHLFYLIRLSILVILPDFLFYWVFTVGTSNLDLKTISMSGEGVSIHHSAHIFKYWVIEGLGQTQKARSRPIFFMSFALAKDKLNF